jgi:hypothetical protein
MRGMAESVLSAAEKVLYNSRVSSKKDFEISQNDRKRSRKGPGSSFWKSWNSLNYYEWLTIPGV